MSISGGGNSRISPESVLLGYLYKGPDHGYELYKRMAEEFGYIWHVSQSQLYNILNRLVEKGEITSTSVEQVKLPAKQVLKITEIGIRNFETWLETPTKCSVHSIRVEFITRLYFMRLYYPEMVSQMIAKQLELLSGGIQELKKLEASAPGSRTVNQMALELRIRLLTSVEEWLVECRSQDLQTTN